jgi:hypothetical protein
VLKSALLLVAASAALARADSMTLKSLVTANFPAISGTVNGLRYNGRDFDTVVFQSSNPIGHQVAARGYDVQIQTGILVAQTATSWTFDGGTLNSFLGLRPLKRFEFVAKLLARGLAVELPRDLDSIPVHSPIPGFRFLT